VDKVVIDVVRLDEDPGGGTNTVLSPLVCTPKPTGALVVGTPVYVEPQPTEIGTGATYDVPMELRIDNTGASATPVAARIEDDFHAVIGGGPVPGKVDSVTAGELGGATPVACALHRPWFNGSSARLLNGPGILPAGGSCSAKLTARVTYPGRVPIRNWVKTHASTVYADDAAALLIDGPRAENTSYAPPTGLVTRVPG
jgi:hypothetical protein